MSALPYLDRLLWKSIRALDLKQWQPLSATCRSICTFVRNFLRGLRILDLSRNGKVNLSHLARACPNLEDIRLSMLPITSHSLTYLSTYSSQLQALDLRECRMLTDAALHSIFSHLQLRSLDVSWAAEFSDAPWDHAPASLKAFRGVGCEHLTERVVVHLSSRCPDLEVLHCSRHINWIGATRQELLASLQVMICLQDVSFQDIPLDDELLYTLACLPSLSRLELWSYNSEHFITGAGVICLSEKLGSSLTKLSLDSFAFHGNGVLTALSSNCWTLQELLLEGTAGQCRVGQVDGLRLPPTVVKLRLPGCGLAGLLNLANLVGLRYLWLFDNPGLEGVQGAGQQLQTLNLGSTSCRRIEGFLFDDLDLLDLSGTCACQKDLEAILLAAPVITRAVLGKSFDVHEASLLGSFLEQAGHLRNLSLCWPPGAVGRTLLPALFARLSESLAPELWLLEIREESCASVAEWLTLEPSDVERAERMVLRRSGKDVQIWMIEQLEHVSPYGRVDGADDSWLPSAVLV